MLEAAFGHHFYTVGTNTIRRRRFTVGNFINVAEFDRNMVKRERSQQNVASWKETYNQPWQTVGLQKRSVP